MSAVLVAVVVTLLLSLCIVARAWFKGEYGVALMGIIIAALMFCILPVMGKLMM